MLYKLLSLSFLVTILASCSFTPSTTLDEEGPAADAVLLREGEFEGADAFHHGAGNLLIVQEGEERTVRLENFESTAGPGLVVLLVENIEGTNNGSIGEYVKLGELKSTNGNQNYMVPEDLDLSKYTGVMIYCEPFQVVFSRAAFK